MMSRQMKSFLVKQTILSFFLNGIINGLIAYFLNKNSQIEAISMQQNYINLIIDISITALIFAWLIAWSVMCFTKPVTRPSWVPLFHFYS
jgi:hypothetical protein